jgi:predicted DNA binding CopG/RHH family protein
MQAKTSFPGDPGFKYLDEDEKTLIKGIEANADALQPLPEAEKDAFLAKFHKPESVRKNVTMRMDESTVAGLKAKAEAEGIPYQTLAAMVLKKYVQGALLDRDAVREVVKALQTA